MRKMQPILESEGCRTQKTKLLERRFHFDYNQRPNIYSRTSRTATISRKKPSVYDRMFVCNNRWKGTVDDVPESNMNQPDQEQYTYGANFDTKFNAEFNEPDSNANTISEKIEPEPIKTGTTKPRRSITKSIPYKLIHRMRPMGRRNRISEVEHHLPPSDLIRLFGESSVPGVRDIALSRSFLRRLFWVGSFFFFGFLALRDISQLVSEYYTYPITVDVRLRDSRRLQFPAVTICNLNIVRYSALCIANVSVIKDSMIPRDLRDKLCGIQSSTASLTPTSTVTSTTTPHTPVSTTESSFQSKKTKKPSRKKTMTTTVSSRHKSQQITTTTVSTTENNDGLDDINNYGVMSKDKQKLFGNETGSFNETFGYFINGTFFEELENSTELVTTTSTTPKPKIEDIFGDLGDIASPVEEVAKENKRQKRKTKVPGAPEMTGNVTNSATNSATTPMPAPSTPQLGVKQTSKSADTSSSQNIASMGDNNDIELTEREEKELQENLTNWLAVIYNSNEKIAKELGHQFEDFVLRCTIRSTNCTHVNSFEEFFTPTEGNCFTFKSQKLRKSYLEKIKDETSIAGVNYGLELVLNLEISEYLTGTAQIGAIIMIQHPDEIGVSASEAIFVAPQQSTYIGLKMVNISRLPKPYPEECIDHWPAALIGRLTQNASYSQQACLKICLQRTIHTRCNCQSAMLPQLELNSTLKICDTRRKITRNCVEEVMFQAEEKVSTCKCPPRCQVVNYDKTVSMTRWPTREDKVTFDRGKANINFQNLAKVTVYFQTMTCQEVRQEKAYTTAKLFSSLGGILGMYVGFSFLSVFEILEIFFRRFWYLVTKKQNRFRAAVHTITATLALNSKRPANTDIEYFNKSSKKQRKEIKERYAGRALEANKSRIAF